MSRIHYPPAMQPAAHSPLGMSLANTPVLAISRPMPQRPMRPPRSRNMDRRKRYGMVFDTNPLYEVYEDGDDESTWSMSRSRPPRRIPPGRSTSSRTRNSSPAQEIASRWRASHSTGEGPRPRVSSTVTYLDIPSTDGISSGTSAHTHITSVSGPRLRFRRSRVSAMDQAAREAYVMAIRYGCDWNIPCQRPGCRGILPNLRSLASHIAMHDIDSAERFPPPPSYDSFLDLGHSVGGRDRMRFPPSPAPYALAARRHKHRIREYLSKLACRCYHDDDF